MIRQNLHTHTIYDDGKNTPAEMAEAAIAAGFDSLGFSGHSILPFENDWSMTGETEKEYLAAVKAVRETYSDRISIFCGLEWDLLSTQDISGFDYIIGAIHHMNLPVPIPPSVDESPETTSRILSTWFSNDPASMADAYYAQYEALSKKAEVDIVAHFDLLTKFDEKHSFFQEKDPRYIDAAMTAMNLLLDADKIFEVNTGAMSRGWRTTPYPSGWLLREINRRHGRITVSADAHSAGALSYAFSETEPMLREFGFRERWEYTYGGFKPVSI